MAGYIPEFFLEQYALGELEGEKKELIDNSPDLQEKIMQLHTSDDEILRKYPPGSFTTSLEKRSIEKKSRHKILQFAVKARVPLVAAACLALFFATLPIMINRSQEPVADTREMTRVKGMQPTLHIYRDNNGEPELLADQAIVKESDRLQISYISAGMMYGAIFSIDGRGTVTLHFPENETVTPALDSEGEIALPYSYELDDAPAYEQFIFVTSEIEFSVADLLTTVRESTLEMDDAASVEPIFPDNFEKTMIYLRKGE